MTIQYQSIGVKHNIEVAHRLYELPGKCEQIHGHSMWVTMELFGKVNSKGILAGIEYGDLKKMFRGHLDETYDHRLLLNHLDPFARPLFQVDAIEGPLYDSPDPEDRSETGNLIIRADKQIFLPGLQTFTGDPTTENISLWVATEMQAQFEDNNITDLHRMEVTVWETSVNMAKTVLSLDSAEMQRRKNGPASK